MGNKLVHDYDHINLNITWDVIKTAIPQLLLLLENIVPSENENL
ncbi:MAG TPA: HepT-like ribonuclease domain-containing protein [Allocoleopsis sp.]